MERKKYPSLRSYLNSLKPAEQESYASRCGTSVGYLRKVLSTGERMRESLCISLAKESGGLVPLPETAPDVDWAFVRKSLAKPPSISRKAG